MSEPLLKVAQLQAWERAKGELRAMLAASQLLYAAPAPDVDRTSLRIKSEMDRFIEKLDELTR